LINAILDEVDPENDSNELIALMCMNVIMPTAMVTMHESEVLSQQSAITAARATALMEAVLKSSDDEKIRAAIIKQCDAILKVAQESGDTATQDDATVKYWTEFFDRWGYQEQQRSDISDVVRKVLKA
jgi:DNA/RNA-binding domain of Phe-tRNA-synthetase-like protein